MLKQMKLFYWQNDIKAVKLPMVVTVNKSWFFKKGIEYICISFKTEFEYDLINLKHREMIIFHFVSVF